MTGFFGGFFGSGLHRITFPCLPGPWCRGGAPLSLGCAPRQKVLLLLLLLFIASSLLLLGVYQNQLWGPRRRSGPRGNT